MAIKFNTLNNLLQQDFTIENSKKITTAILEILGINKLNFIYTQNSLRKITDTTKKGMFVDDSEFADFKAAYDISNSHFDTNVKHKQLILPRLFVIKQYSRSNIIWLNKLGINYEDEPQLNGFYPLGLDFIVCQNRFLVVISNQDNLRVLELNQGEELNSTQSEILASWQNLFAEESNKKLLHSKLWDSLNLESVNKKFYIDIIQNFASLKQHLIENKHFDNNQVVIFTNRLIGRLLFCYFLIKKGFIPTDYLELDGQNDNEYYHNKLSQLFFAVLNTPINERSHTDRTTPYLNGGLFERKDTDIVNVTFPSNYFNSIFAIFRKYNWTVDESLSNYEVMAIDPEMLGRIFENLLAEINVDNDVSSESARKAKGAFYTPRIIVDYMCKESLRQYLQTNSPEHSYTIINRLLDDSIGYLTDQKKNWTDDVKPYKEHLISLLDKITVFDPACGSGAFPMGVLQLILNTYERLGDKLKPSNRKIKIIENSIFGADIEPNAIEIARLRAWLSIVVNEDKQDIEPLPNLDFKFVCCNSLIKLETKGQSNLADNLGTVEKLQELQHKYFRARTYKSKLDIRKQYNDLIKQSRSQNSLFGKSKYLEQIESYHPFDTQNICQFYDNQFMFGISDGFDVVIGNPPYVDSEAMTRMMPDLREYINNNYQTTKGNWDLYIAFLEHGFRLLNKLGILGFITPDKWVAKPFGEKFREVHFSNLLKVLRCGRDIFSSALVDAIVTLFTNANNNEIQVFKLNNQRTTLLRTVDKMSLTSNSLDLVFSDNLHILTKLNQFNKIGEYFQCENACATSDAYKLKPLIKSQLIENNEFLQVVNTGTIGKYTSKYGINEMKYLKDKYRYPVVLKSKFIEHFGKTYIDRALSPKLIIKGLTLLDACLDINGMIIPGKSTLVIKGNNVDKLKYLSAIINSKFAIFVIKQTYSSNSYNGGINFNKDMINRLPYIEFDKYNSIQNEILKLVDKIILIQNLPLLASNNSVNDIEVFQKTIDKLVYELYDITPEEITVIESK
ncbi:MAG: BREX-1 system adenine-specific DNA-methyltransferase PglX [Proteobacteria bacterium]|nr:BREX-1 system adenine-specific DNA-methyltransferase PglX [Pseudomonadota bacterium]